MCKYHKADASLMHKVIMIIDLTNVGYCGALKAKPKWEELSFERKVAIFFKAADLLSTKYR